MIDPKAELKIQKAAGNNDILIGYERIGQIADKTRELHLSYLFD